MLKSVRKLSVVCLLILLTLSLLTLSGCTNAIINNGLHRNECELYVNALLKGDYSAAQAVAPTIPDAEHRPYFEVFCKSFEGANSYELTQTGWNINTTNGVTTQTASYQIELDNGTICQLTLQAVDGTDGIAFINFNDSTEFIESTKDVKTTNIVLLIVSIAVMAFPIWMLVDCVKRPMLKKALWIIVILLSLSLSFVSGPNTSTFNFMANLFLIPSSMKAVVPNETITLTISIPLGALIYFLCRKKLTKKYKERVESQSMAALADAMEITIAAIDSMDTSAPSTPPSVSDYPQMAEFVQDAVSADQATKEDPQNSKQA